MHSRIFLLTASLACTLTFSSAMACEACDDKNHDNHAHLTSTANDHAPIGVMGDHMHRKGEWMFSYRFEHMNMEGNRNGTHRLSLQDVIAFPNQNTGPANLRVVPTKMTMDMHMLGAMYAPTDWLTLMVMGMYADKSMDHTTFNMAGTQIGTFTTKSSGWGDTSLTGLIRLYDDSVHHLHLNAGISLPTGSIDEEDDVLAPNGTTPKLRLPYGMQLGSGTYDALPGITYTGHKGVWEWGAQYQARLPLENRNSQSYAWGDKHSVTGWGSYEWAPWISTSARLTGSTQSKIDGADPLIAAPVQTADPDNYGGQTIELGFGINLLGTKGDLKGHRMGIEATAPLYRDLNGPQLETDWHIKLGWQYAF